MSAEGAKTIAGDLVKRAASHGGDKLLEESAVLILWLLEEREASAKQIADQAKVIADADEHIAELTEAQSSEANGGSLLPGLRDAVKELEDAMEGNHPMQVLLNHLRSRIERTE